MNQAITKAQPEDVPATVDNGLSRRRVILSSLLMVCAAIACRDVWLDIIHIVRKDEEASHILLVPLVFARIVWVRRGNLKGVELGPSLWGPAIILAGIGCWLFGNIKALQVVWHFGGILAVFGAFVCVNGMGVVRRLWPAFFVLLFLMPMPGMIRYPLALFLQNVSAQATEVVVVALGFDLVRHNNLLLINDYPVGIAEACNGMRMISMLILVVFAFVFSEKIRPWVQVVMVLLAAPMAILLNIFRLVPTVLAYGFFSPELADQLHDWLGWVMVFASYFMLLAILVLMRWLLLPMEPVAPAFSNRTQLRRPTRRQGAERQPIRPGIRLALSLVAACLMFGGAMLADSSLPDGSEAEGYHAQVREIAADLPREIGPWSAVDVELPPAAVALLKPNVLISRRYTDEKTGLSFSMLIVQCADARDMDGHYPPICYPNSGWKSLGRQSVRLELGSMIAKSMDYRFERAAVEAVDRISVVNMILMPGNGYVTSMADIRRLAGTISDRYFGAAQVQFVFDERWEKEQRLEVVEQVGEAFEPLMRVILDKKGKQG